MIGGGALLCAGIGSLIAYSATQVRCDTVPEEETGWHFSRYCTALHSLHLFNYPDKVSGGGVLEGIFALPALFTIAGLIIALRIRRFAPLGRALSLAGLLIALLFVLNFVFASATYPFPGGP